MSEVPASMTAAFSLQHQVKQAVERLGAGRYCLVSANLAIAGINSPQLRSRSVHLRNASYLLGCSISNLFPLFIERFSASLSESSAEYIAAQC